MVTGDDVFSAAMALSANFVNGLAVNSDTAEYLSRSKPLINLLGYELYQFSDTRAATAGLRPTFTKIVSMSDPLNLDEGLALSVMPHGLVALLFADDNAELANYHEQKYMEKKAEFRSIPGEFSDIEDIYGMVEYAAYSDD